MRKLIAALLICMFSFGVSFAGGDQNQGTTGSGTTSTGSICRGTGSQSRSGR